MCHIGKEWQSSVNVQEKGEKCKMFLIFTVFSQYFIQDELFASPLSLKLPFGGFRVLAVCSNSADLQPLCMVHWPLFSNSELSGTVWKQNKALLLHYRGFPSPQTAYYSYGP